MCSSHHVMVSPCLKSSLTPEASNILVGGWESCCTIYSRLLALPRFRLAKALHGERLGSAALGVRAWHPVVLGDKVGTQSVEKAV
jgi:hypothetical protein